MKFTEYLKESKEGKNVHLEHLEDDVLNNGSSGAINNYLKHYTGKDLFINDEAEITRETKKTDFMKKFFALYKKYHKPSANDPLIENLKTFESTVKAKDAESPGSFVFSKYMNLKFLDIMISSGKENQICNDILHYAKSNIEESSYFIKIS